MNRMDDALKEALRREDPGPDFTRMVLERAAAAPTRRSWWQRFADCFRPTRVRWIAAGALACALLATGLEYHHEMRERAEGEAAKEKLVMALRVAGTKLYGAQTKVLQRSY